MKMEQTECPEMSAYKIQTPGNHPEERIQHSVHGESLKSRINYKLFVLMTIQSAGKITYTISVNNPVSLPFSYFL